MNEQEERVHVHHCCKKHGCKYGDEDCPVAYGDAEQYYPCQDCDDYYDDYLDEEREAKISMYIEQIMKERKEVHEKERKAYWKGFITAILVIILLHIGLSYVMFSN